MASRATLYEIMQDVEQCKGKRVVLRTNKGKRKARVAEGIVKDVFPAIFTVRIDDGTSSQRTVSFSYSDILTESVEVTIVETDHKIDVS